MAADSARVKTKGGKTTFRTKVVFCPPPGSVYASIIAGRWSRDFVITRYGMVGTAIRSSS